MCLHGTSGKHLPVIRGRMSTIGARASLVNDLRTTQSPCTLTHITNTRISKLVHITKVLVCVSSRLCLHIADAVTSSDV